MKAKNIKLDDDEMPETITVEMTVDEAAVVYALVGFIAPRTTSMALGGTRWGEAMNDVATCLSGSFFNRFWESAADVVPRWHNLNEILRKVVEEDE